MVSCGGGWLLGRPLAFFFEAVGDVASAAVCSDFGDGVSLEPRLRLGLFSECGGGAGTSSDGGVGGAIGTVCWGRCATGAVMEGISSQVVVR